MYRDISFGAHHDSITGTSTQEVHLDEAIKFYGAISNLTKVRLDIFTSYFDLDVITKEDARESGMLSDQFDVRQVILTNT